MRYSNEEVREMVRDAILAARQCPGILIQELKNGDELVIRTLDAEYQCTMADPLRSIVIITSTDGGLFPHAKLAHLIGSCILMKPMIVRTGWLGYGYPVFIEGMTTSPLQRLELNGEVLLPHISPCATQ